MTEQAEGAHAEVEAVLAERDALAAEIEALSPERIRKRFRTSRLKVEPLTVDVDGEPLTVDVHEISGGERVSFLERARKLSEGKIDGGTKKFYRELIARTVHAPGTKQRVWTDRDAETIDDLPQELHEALMKKAMAMNGMDPDAVKNAKNGSSKDA